MDKKAKKRLDALHQKLQLLRQQLAGARKQADDPQEIKRIMDEIASAEAEVEKWRNAK